VVKLPPHLLLAPDYATALKFIQTELGGPWEKVRAIHGGAPTNPLSAANVRLIRSDYPESLWWIKKQYGERLTGYDLAEAIKVWLKNNNAEDKSVCEVLKERGWKGIGEAEVFLSHVQAEFPGDTLDAMRRIDKREGPARKGTKHQNSKIWVDYFCLRQLKNDFKTQQVEQLIRKTGAVYVYMDGEETGGSYPTRSFCVFELAAAVENVRSTGGTATLMIRAPNSGPLAAPECPCTCCTYTCPCTCCICTCCGTCIWHPMPDYTIDAANATARRADDKAKVDKYIEEGPGFARVNQMMERELRRTAVKRSWQKPAWYFCCPCLFMGQCFDDCCCGQCNPFGCLFEVF